MAGAEQIQTGKEEKDMKSGALFDMDGTLIDTEKLYRKYWRKWIEAQGYAFDPAFTKDICGTSGAYARQVIRKYYPGIEADDLRHQVRQSVYDDMTKGVPEKPGAREILNYLKEKGVKLALATSSGHGRIEAYVKGCHMEGIFDALVSGHDLQRSKPEPDIFLHAAEALHLSPKDCYVFEDGINGVRAGAAAGCATVMVPDYLKPDEEIRSLCVGVYDTLFEALEALRAGEI